MKRTYSIIKIVFSFVGISALLVALLVYIITTSFLQTAEKANGVVIDLHRSVSSDSTTYRPEVEFETLAGEKIRFISNTGSNPPSFSRGEKVEVLYQQDEPQQAKINTFLSLWLLPLLFGVLGFIFTAIGLSFVFYPIYKRKKIQRIKQFGTIVQAEFQSVNRNTSLTVNGRHPYQITAQWQDPVTSKIYVFESENLWFDPSDFIVSEALTVWIEKGKPKNHYIDISFLPELAE